MDAASLTSSLSILRTQDATESFWVSLTCGYRQGVKAYLVLERENSRTARVGCRVCPPGLTQSIYEVSWGDQLPA